MEYLHAILEQTLKVCTVFESLLSSPARKHMGSFPHPTHYFAAAGENDDFVIAAINFMLNQSL